MRAAFSLSLLASLATAAALAQQPQQLQQQRPQTPPVAFDVATIKMSPPLDPTKMMRGQIRIGAKIDGARAEYNFMTLSDLICNAYKIKDYQLTGPDWMKAQRWDIQATLPEGAPADQAPQMLQELLKERFKLEFHRGVKEHNVYVLVEGRGGHKMKDAEPDPAPAPAAAVAEAGGPKEEAAATKDGKGPQSGTMTVNGENITMKRTSDGAVVRGGKMGTTKVSMNNGQMHMEFSKAEMADLAEMLTRFVDRPVVDETGLKGKYQIQLDLSMADMMNAARQSGMMGAMGGGPPPPGAGGGPGGARPADSASDPGGSATVFAAVEQMGLKLTPKKAPMDTIEVDHLEKTPTEN